MLRNKADRRSIFFMAITTALFVAQWMAPHFQWALFLPSCFMALIVFVIVHNHSHLPMWKAPILNHFQSYWLTLFYGYPVFAWIPTHIRNHHVLNNRAGDDSLTYRHTEGNHLLSLLSYPAVSGGAQQRTNIRFIKGLWGTDRRKCVYYLSQAGALLIFTLIGLFINWKKALYAIVIPQQVSLNGVLMINYMQHVHADEESRWNHSRNFVGGFANWLLLNNGYHTIHHEKPLQHWSENAAAHAKIAHHIDPTLCEQNPVGYIVRAYILGAFDKRFATRSMRLRRLNVNQESEALEARGTGALAVGSDQI